MQTIYIVQGRTGEYEDFVTWLVRGFATERAAYAYQRKLTKALEAAQLVAGWSPRSDHAGVYDKVEAAMSKLDPDFRIDYTDTVYEVLELDFVGTKKRRKP
jgi:hypothetical protein